MPGELSAADPAVFAVFAGLVLAAGLLLAALRPRTIVRHPRSVLLATALVTLAALAALVDPGTRTLRLRIDASTDPLLPVGDPAAELYHAAVRDFGDDEVFVIAIECDEVFTPACLGAMDRVSDRLVHLEGVRSVRSLLDVTSFRYVPADDWVEVCPFIEEIPTEPDELAELRRRALADPVYRRTLVADDSRAAALNVSFHKMSDEEFIASDLDGRIATILAESAGPGQRFYIAGRPHVKARVYIGVLEDLRHLIPLSVAVVAMVLWLITGTRRGVGLPLVTALTATLWTFAAMAFLGRPLSLLTGLLCPTLLAIGSVYGVHVLARYEEEAEVGGTGEAVALRCLLHLLAPVLIAGLTTSLGFGALLITDVPAVFELGAFSVLGVASITLLSLSFGPALLALLPVRPRQRRTLDRGLEALLVGLARAVRRHVAAVLAVAALAALAAAWAIPRIVIDTDYITYLDPSDPVRRDFEAVNRLLAGAIPLYVVIGGEGPGSFREPDLLTAVDEMRLQMDGLPGVSRTQSFIDSVRMLNRAFSGDDAAEERIPETRPGVAELLFMIPKPELARFATVNHGRANLIVRTGEVGSSAIASLTASLEETIAEHPLPHGATAHVTGNAILLARSADGIARGQPWTVGLAALGIFTLISVGLRSVRLGAVAMVPNVVPVLMFFGLLGLGAAPLSLPTSLIGSVALGIAIDDTAHFLVRYRAERVAGATAEEAALRCGRSVGRPIAITSVMLFLGFWVVAFSEFATLREFGVLSALTMALCLVTDLVLLPAILVRLRI